MKERHYQFMLSLDSLLEHEVTNWLNQPKLMFQFVREDISNLLSLIRFEFWCRYYVDPFGNAVHEQQDVGRLVLRHIRHRLCSSFTPSAPASITDTEPAPSRRLRRHASG